MKTSYILAGIVVAVVVVGGVVMLRSNSNPQVSSLGEEENIEVPLEEQAQSSPTVVYSDEGYFPKELTIKKGGVVTFRNESAQSMWTASAMHPNHTAYPGTDTKNCGNAMMMGMMFDTCAETPVGSSWTFQFNEAGSWGYHNHMRATHFGKIIVE